MHIPRAATLVATAALCSTLLITPAVADPAATTQGDDPVADLALNDAGDAIVTDRDERLIAPGLELTRFSRLSADGWLSGEVLVAHLGPRADLERGQVGVGYIGADRVAGTGTISELADDHGAAAAVNADYFDINNSGAPHGTAVQDGELVKSADPGHNRSLGFAADGTGRLAELFLEGEITVDGTSWAVDGLNVTEVAAGGIAVYDARWGDHTRTRPLLPGEDGVEVTVDTGGTVLTVGRPAATQLDDGVRAIVARPGTAADALAALTPGDEIELTYQLRDDAGDLATAVGGGVEDWLLEDGEVTSGTGSHVELRHPRTAVGLNASGSTAYFVVIDGRQASSIGMNLYELGEFLGQLGADDAINLDGGGSSDMVARLPGDSTTTVLNNPSDGSERPVPNGLGLFTPDGSGRLDAFDLRTTIGAPDADRIFPGLHRRLDALGYDEVMAPVDTRPSSWSTDARPVARVSDQGVLTGLRAGTTTVTAEHRTRNHRATGSIEIEVLDELVRTDTDRSVITLAGAGTQDRLVLTGYDADGFTAPIDARDVEVTGGDGVAELVPAADGSFTVRAVAGSGATTFELAVDRRTVAPIQGGDIVTEVAVAIGLDQVPVTDFTDAADWTSDHARAPGGSVAPADGQDGSAGLRLTYDFTQSTATRGQYAVAPGGGTEIAGQPRKITMWVNGDGNGAWLRLQVQQADGVTTNLNGPEVTWTGWRLAEFTVPDGLAFPLTFERIRALEIRADAQYTGEIVVSDLTAHVAPEIEVPEARQVEDPVLVADGATDRSPLRVAVLSDAQFVARDPDSPAVQGARDALREIVAADPDLLVINGDFVDEATPADFELARQILDEELADADFDWHYLPGNHEIMGSDISNFIDAFGATNRVLDVPAPGGRTRVVMLDSSTGRLGDDFAQLQMLRSALDDAATDPAVTGVLVFQHHPLDDPLPTEASQLSDRLEAETLRDWFEDFEERSGKSIASVAAHAGVFDASRSDGVPYLVNGNSGKSPASTADNGGFTGWSMLGIDPADGDRNQADDWLSWEVATRAESVDVSGPERLQTGERARLDAVVLQDGTREVPVDWPVSSSWGGTQVCVTDNLRHPGSDCSGRKVLALHAETHAIRALRPGTARVEVTVNGETGTLDVTATR